MSTTISNISAVGRRKRGQDLALFNKINGKKNNLRTAAQKAAIKRLHLPNQEEAVRPKPLRIWDEL